MALCALTWLGVALGAAVVGGDVVGTVSGLALGGLLVTIAWTARDAVRHDRHDRFEAVHRYGGWSALANISVVVGWDAWWSSTITPAVVLLVVAIALAASPWISVRRVTVDVIVVPRR
jgi:hypothetical protein